MRKTFLLERGENRVEKTIIKKAIAGDEHAFRMIVEKYSKLVFYTVFPILRNQKDAEDATQEIFLKLFLSLPKYKNQGFKTWLLRIATNHAIDMRRKAYRKREVAIEDMQGEDLSVDLPKTPSSEVSQQIIEKEFQQYIHKRINELPENYRNVVYGFYIEEKTYEEMAEQFNVKRATIATQLYRARLWMKKHWKESDFL